MQKINDFNEFNELKDFDLQKAAQLAVLMLDGNDYVRCYLASKLKDLPNAAEIADKLKQDDQEQVREALAANLLGLPNAAELGNYLQQDSNESVREALAANLKGLPNAIELSNTLKKDEDYNVREALSYNLKGLENAAELALEMVDDPESSVIEALVNNIDDLPNGAEVAEKIMEDYNNYNEKHYWVLEALAANLVGLSNAETLANMLVSHNIEEVRESLARNLEGLPNAKALAVKLSQDEFDFVREALPPNLMSELMTQLSITFYLPCDNQTPTGHEANVSLIINQSDISRLDSLKAMLGDLGAHSIDVESDSNNTGSLKIGLEGITFDSTVDTDESGIYRGTLKITKDENVIVQILSNNGDSYESYDGLNLKHLKKAYLHAVEQGVTHVTINDALKARFSAQKPAMVNEITLFSADSCYPIENLVGEPLNLAANDETQPHASAALRSDLSV